MSGWRRQESQLRKQLELSGLHQEEMIVFLAAVVLRKSGIGAAMGFVSCVARDHQARLA